MVPDCSGRAPFRLGGRTSRGFARALVNRLLRLLDSRLQEGRAGWPSGSICWARSSADGEVVALTRALTPGPSCVYATQRDLKSTQFAGSYDSSSEPGLVFRVYLR